MYAYVGNDPTNLVDSTGLLKGTGGDSDTNSWSPLKSIQKQETWNIVPAPEPAPLIAMRDTDLPGYWEGERASVDLNTPSERAKGVCPVT